MGVSRCNLAIGWVFPDKIRGLPIVNNKKLGNYTPMTASVTLHSDQLKPLKNSQIDLFVIDALDVIVKDDLPSMEYPFYSLSKKPDREVRRYEYKDRWIEFRPSVKGLPTIYDKDLMIYAISHLVSALDQYECIPKEVEIDPYHYLRFTERGTGGRDYQSLIDSLDRLDGTRFRTNITQDGLMIDEWQGLIDKAAMTTNEITGKLEKLRITLSDMVIQTIKKKEVLTLNRDYFRLKKPIERRLYELSRKHTGTQRCWSVSLKILHNKTGSKSSLKEFRRAVKHLVEHNHLPDYEVYFHSELDQVTFYPRKTFISAIQPKATKTLPELDELTLDIASTMLPNFDILLVEKEWRQFWAENGYEKLKDHNQAFLGFCRKKIISD